MEQEDCYYFLYSTCKRGASCGYRHNPYTKLNPVLCEEWDRTKKCREDCPFRHSYYHLKKNRSDDFCFWEDKESGCTKEFCEFRHRNPEKDAWKVDGVKSLSQIKKVKNLGQRAAEFEMDPADFENERRERRLEKQLKAESRSQRLAPQADRAPSSPEGAGEQGSPTAAPRAEPAAREEAKERVADPAAQEKAQERALEKNAQEEQMKDAEQMKDEVPRQPDDADEPKAKRGTKKRKVNKEEELDRELAELEELMKEL